MGMIAIRGPAALAGIVALTLLPTGTLRAEDPIPDRETSLVVYGNDACPQPRDENEIVVCARRPEEERYRIPPALRASRERRHDTAWGTAVAQLEREQAYTRPGGCSPVGSFGQTGCQQMFMNHWFAERAMGHR